MTQRLVSMTGSRGQDWQLLTAGAFVSMIVPRDGVPRTAAVLRPGPAGRLRQGLTVGDPGAAGPAPRVLALDLGGTQIRAAESCCRRGDPSSAPRSRTPVATGRGGDRRGLHRGLAEVREAASRARPDRPAPVGHRDLGPGSRRPVRAACDRRPAEPGGRLPRHPARAARRERPRSARGPRPRHPGGRDGRGPVRGGRRLRRLPLRHGLDRHRWGDRHRGAPRARARRDRRRARAPARRPPRPAVRLRDARPPRGHRVRQRHRATGSRGRRARARATCSRSSCRPGGTPSGRATWPTPRRPATPWRRRIMEDARDAFAVSCVSLAERLQPVADRRGRQPCRGPGRTPPRAGTSRRRARRVPTAGGRASRSSRRRSATTSGSSARSSSSGTRRLRCGAGGPWGRRRPRAGGGAAS